MNWLSGRSITVSDKKREKNNAVGRKDTKFNNFVPEYLVTKGSVERSHLAMKKCI